MKDNLMGSAMEVATLAVSMTDDVARDIVVNQLTADHYTDRKRKIVFNALRDMNEEGMSVDVITLAEFLSNRGQLNEIGDIKYLGGIAQSSHTIANADTYAKLVKDAFTVKSLTAVGEELMAMALSEGTSAEKIERAESMLSNIGVANSTGPMRIHEAMGEFIDAMEERSDRDGQLIGLPTGLDDLDEKTYGLQPTDVIVIAGRPSQGKTTLAENVFSRNTIKDNKAGLFFSLEMDKVSIIERMFSSWAGVSLERIRKAELLDIEWDKLTKFIAMTEKSKAYIDDEGGLTIGEIRARARAVHRKCPLSVIVIDYLQLINGGKGETQTLRVGDISRQLKELAKELNVPVILLSQLSRSVDQRSDKRPMMSDLRDSGAIEQDADVIMFIYRDETYNPDSDSKGIAEILIRKQRKGPIGEVFARFEGHHCRFKDLNPKDPYADYDSGASGYYPAATPEAKPEDYGFAA